MMNKKKLLGLGILLLLFLEGCETKETTVYKESENNNLRPASATHFIYKEHDYIMFQWWMTGYDLGISYVHDPDCRKCNEKKENRELN